MHFERQYRYPRTINHAVRDRFRLAVHGPPPAPHAPPPTNILCARTHEHLSVLSSRTHPFDGGVPCVQLLCSGRGGCHVLQRCLLQTGAMHAPGSDARPAPEPVGTPYIYLPPDSQHARTHHTVWHTGGTPGTCASSTYTRLHIPCSASTQQPLGAIMHCSAVQGLWAKKLNANLSCRDGT